MIVGVGFSDNPSSVVAGADAARQAIQQAGCQTSCDVVLLFCTARHDAQQLRDAVATVVGENVPIYGGGAVGIITNEQFGYAGDQMGLACLWLEGSRCDVISERGLLSSEKETGYRLGKGLAQKGAHEDSPVMLFYDAVDVTKENVRLLMATWLLEGMKEGLGFLPQMAGAGLQGDHVCTPVPQFEGEGLSAESVMALMFSDDIQIDTAIMHGCKPASHYYTVTKAEGPVILEINGKPAIPFMQELLGPAIGPEQYPFFLLFGINHGDKWGEYDENNYASRLCMGIDVERSGIVMFEPDMVAGTRFQLMFRSFDFDYMKPKIEETFAALGDREPVFGMYIDCAGRCAGYGGLDMEDALVIQQAVQGRVPLLGLYTGVEIAEMGGEPRGLDWTGVFCLFSQSKNKGDKSAKRRRSTAWEPQNAQGDMDNVPLDAALQMCEQNAAKILQLDTQLIATRSELEQKRRAFALLAELVTLLRNADDYHHVFLSVAQRINAAVNMQKTAILMHTSQGAFMPTVLQGYSEEEKKQMTSMQITLPPEFLDPSRGMLVNGGDDPQRFSSLREALRLPYFTSSPIVVNKEIVGVLFTGRMTEQPPFLSRLGGGDVETVQAIVALLTSILVRQRLNEAEERTRLMLDATPLCANFWDQDHNNIDCNLEAIKLYGFSSKEDYLQNFDKLSPEFQPDGSRSIDQVRIRVDKAFREGRCEFEWMHQSLAGEPIPCQITLVRVAYKGGDVVIGYTRDLRELKAQMAEIEKTQEELRKARDRAEENSRAKTAFLANMSHEIRTPLNAIIGMTRIARNSHDLEQVGYCLGKTEDASHHLLGIINDVLDMSKIDSGKFTLSYTDFTVEALLTQVANVINFKADEKQLQFVIKADKDVPISIISDQQRLAQVITNLLSNAVKFTPEGGQMTLLVHKKAEEDDGACILHFEVVDNGIGVSPQQQSRLFESFVQADGSISRKFGGTGLGLSISKDIVEMMGGSIWVESELGKGSNFQFTIAAKRGQKKQHGSFNSAIRWKDVRILVVDDAPEVLEYFQDITAASGLHCDTAASGEEACALLEKVDPYHIIFVDLKMPGMDGIELTRKIHADYGEQVVVVMISATGWSLIEESAKSVGIEKFIPKPLLPSPIIDCINECLCSNQDCAGDAQAEPGKDSGVFRGKRAIIAEDIEINREIVTVLLENTGIELVPAENGLVALDLFKNNPEMYDLILMDIHMPEMDGYEATKKIRALGTPAAASIPIIAMTANVFTEDVEQCLAVGMNGHVGKPIDIDELLEKMRQVL